MRFFISFCLLLTVAACADLPLGQMSLHIPDEGWRKEDTLILAVVPDSNVYVRSKECMDSWKVQVDVRHTNDYPYANLVLRLTAPQNDTVLCLPLADSGGQWTGHGVGYLYQSSYPAGMLQLGSDKADTLHFRIVSLMPDSVLRGMHDIGVRLTRK